jgi:hypothetical protein
MASEVAFAEIPKSKASGAVIRTAGITGRIRGMHFTTRDGSHIGPSFVIADDPQDDRSAKSIPQTDLREKLLLSTIKGLKRTGKQIGIVIPCTVIRKGDLADRLMDRARHPDIVSKRTKMLYALPKNLDLWERYARLYGDDRAAGGSGKVATEFYAANLAAMNEGAKPAWEHDFDADEISAVEHAMRWYLFNRAGFMAECQQEPAEERTATGRLEVDEIYQKLDGRRRGSVPTKCEWLTAHVDVNEGLLYFWVSCWERNFTGYAVDYGAWPEQSDRWFAMDSCRNPLAVAYKGMGKGGMVFAGLEAVLERLFSARFRRDDGATMPIDLVGVDSRYDQEIVANVIRKLGRGKQLIPTMGIGFSAAGKPYSHFKAEPGATIGRNWRKALNAKTKMLTLSIDTNRWKSFYRDRIRVPMAEPGCYSFFGDPRRTPDAKMAAEHHAAEFPTLTAGPYGEIEIWKHDRLRGDNHLWDTAVGAAVLASAIPDGPKLPEWEWRRPGAKAAKSSPRQAVSYF